MIVQFDCLSAGFANPSTCIPRDNQLLFWKNQPIVAPAYTTDIPWALPL